LEKIYLTRSVDDVLIKWRKQNDRKPLLLRGVRQVGKSSSVHKLDEQFDCFVEVNFEKHREAHQLFDYDLSPQKICKQLSILYDIPIIPGKTLLFFDEI
jgi:predicted AAA+ superfamily ATPase